MFFLAFISIGLEAPIKMTSGDTVEVAEEMKPLPGRLKPKFPKSSLWISRKVMGRWVVPTPCLK